MAGRPGKCGACIHRSRKRIDEMLLRHVPMRAIAAKFNTSLSLIARHKRHLDAALFRDAEARETAYIGGLVADYEKEIGTLMADVRWVQKDAKKRGQGMTLLRAVKEQRENVLAKARLAGALSDQPNLWVILVQGQSSLKFSVLVNDERVGCVLDCRLRTSDMPTRTDCSGSKCWSRNMRCRFGRSG